MLVPMEEVSSDPNPKAEEMVLKPLDDIDLRLRSASRMPNIRCGTLGTFSPNTQSSWGQITRKIITYQLNRVLEFAEEYL